MTLTSLERRRKTRGSPFFGLYTYLSTRLQTATSTPHASATALLGHISWIGSPSEWVALDRSVCGWRWLVLCCRASIGAGASARAARPNLPSARRDCSELVFGPMERRDDLSLVLF